jgi:hypothetical protein
MRTLQKAPDEKKGILDQGWMTFLLLFLFLILVAIFLIALKNPEFLTKLFKKESQVPPPPPPPRLLVPPIIISSALKIGNRKQETGNRKEKSESRKQKAESRKRSLFAFCLLPSAFYLLFPVSCFLFPVSCLLIVGCGYVSTSEYLSHIKSINIPMVTNRTVEYGLDEEVTKSITDRFRRRWGEGNDLLFTITITDFKYEPIKFDANNFPEQYSLIIKLDYTLEDRIEGKTISDKKDYIQRHDFYVVQGRGEEPENEKTAKERLLRELAEQLYSDLAEQW